MSGRKTSTTCADALAHCATVPMIAEHAGVSEPAVWNWIKRHDTFPDPLALLGSIRVFYMPDVVAWIESRKKD